MMIKPSGTPRSQSRIRITSVLLPLHPGGTVAHDRARAGRGPRLVVAEVHRLARAHPAADDASYEPKQHGRGRGERTVAGGLRRVRIDRSARRGGDDRGRREGDVPAAQYGAAEAREREQSDGGDEERDRSVEHRGLGTGDPRDTRGDPAADHEREERREHREDEAAEADAAPRRDPALGAGLVRAERGTDQAEEHGRDDRGERADPDRIPVHRPRRPPVGADGSALFTRRICTSTFSASAECGCRRRAIFGPSEPALTRYSSALTRCQRRRRKLGTSRSSGSNFFDSSVFAAGTVDVEPTATGARSLWGATVFR